MDTVHARKFKVHCVGIVHGIGSPFPVLRADTKAIRSQIARYVFLPYAYRMAVAEQTYAATDTASNNRYGLGTSAEEEMASIDANGGPGSPRLLRVHAFSSETGQSPDDVHPFERCVQSWHSGEDLWVRVDVYAPIFLRLMRGHNDKHGRYCLNGFARDAMRAMGIASGVYTLSYDEVLVAQEPA